MAQTNVESESSLSIYASIVTKESTIIGLRLVKEAVRFYDPVKFSPENIPITKELKLSIRSAHAAYQMRLEEERLELERRKEEARKKRRKQISKKRKMPICVKENISRK